MGDAVGEPTAPRSLGIARGALWRSLLCVVMVVAACGAVYIAVGDVNFVMYQYCSTIRLVVEAEYTGMPACFHPFVKLFVHASSIAFTYHQVHMPL